MPFCTECGAKNDSDYRFCSECGAKKGGSSAAVTAAAPSYTSKPAPKTKAKKTKKKAKSKAGPKLGGGDRCPKCQKPIFFNDASSKVGDTKYHKSCLVCDRCGTQVGGIRGNMRIFAVEHKVYCSAFCQQERYKSDAKAGGGKQADTKTKAKPKFSAAVHIPPTGRVVKEGKVSKKGIVRWNSRHLVLQGGVLRYYTDQKTFTSGKNPRSTLPGTQIKTLNYKGCQMDIVLHNESTFLFKMADPSETQAWYSQIEGLLRR